MSSSQRGKRRKKSSRKTSLERFADKKDHYKKKDNAQGVDFFFLLMGMITTLMVFLMVFSVYSTPPNTTRALKAAESGDASKEVNATDDDEFDILLENSDAKQLTNILEGLNNWSSEDGPEASVKANQRRVEIANHMLTKKLSTEQRRLAITSKLNALTTVYGFGLLMNSGVPNVAQSLRDTSSTYMNSPDEEIQKLAKLSLYKVSAFEISKEGTESSSVGLLVDDTCKLLQDFPEDETVLSSVGMIVDYYRRKVDRVVALKVTEGIEARKSEFVDAPKVLQMIKDFADEALLSTSKLNQLFENRWVEGPRGQRELLKKSIQLAAEPESGFLLVKTIDKMAHWFEQDDQYEGAVAIYEEVLRSVDTYQSPEVAAEAKKRAQDGIARSKLVGEQIELSGYRLDGKVQSADSLQGKVVLVIFWSAFESKSRQVLLKLAVDGKGWKERGIRILAVNIDRSWDTDVIQDVVTAVPNATFVFGNPGDNYANNILKQCPSEVVPRMLLVQKDGLVADINVPRDEVETQLDFLVGQ